MVRVRQRLRPLPFSATVLPLIVGETVVVGAIRVGVVELVGLAVRRSRGTEIGGIINVIELLLQMVKISGRNRITMMMMMMMGIGRSGGFVRHVTGQ